MTNHRVSIRARRREALQTLLLVLVGMHDQGPGLSIQILRNVTNAIFSNTSHQGRRTACSKAAAVVEYSDTFHFSFAVFAQLFGNSELPRSRC